MNSTAGRCVCDHLFLEQIKCHLEIMEDMRHDMVVVLTASPNERLLHMETNLYGVLAKRYTVFTLPLYLACLRSVHEHCVQSRLSRMSLYVYTGA